MYKTRKGRGPQNNASKLLTDGVHPCEVLARMWLRRLELDIVKDCFDPELQVAVDPQEVLAANFAQDDGEC